MAIQQSVNVNVTLVGDGSSTVFTYAWNRLFELIPDPGAEIISPSTIPTSAAVQSADGTIGTPTASLDGFGNLVLTFSTAPASGAIGTVYIQLLFNSGTLAGTTTSWTSSTAANTAWTLPLNGAPAVLVPVIISGTITAGALEFEVSADGSNWFAAYGVIENTPQPVAYWNLTFGNTAVQFNCAGYSYFRVVLNTAITGSGTATFIIQSINQLVNSYISAAALGYYNTTAPGTTAATPVPLQSDGYGNLFVNSIRRSQVVAETGNIASATAATLCAAQGASVYADLASLALTLREGATANVFFGVLISDGTKSYRFNFMSQDVTTFQSASPINMTFDPPIPATAANTAWTIALTSATDTPSVDYVCTFIKQLAE